MKLCILGVAHMHVTSYLKIFIDKKIDILGVYDNDPVRAEQFAKKNQLLRFESLDELLKTDCDTALICSENVFHKSLVLKAAAANKHVIVEKPMALSGDDAQEMIDATQQANVKLMVAHPVRFSKVAQDMKQILHTHSLGKLRSINASNHGKNPGGWFINPALSGGGALIDHTVHICDLVRYFFDLTPKTVTAYKERSMPSLLVEDIGLVQIRFETGVIMSLDTSWNRPHSYPVWGDAVMELVFEKGYLVMDGFGRKMSVFNDSKGGQSNFYYEEDMDLLMIEKFIHAIDENEPSPVNGEDGLYTVNITETAFKSAQKGETINL
ncbi:hypothetical protein IGI37_002178 [Enterococcus sp. AZ194]|uniref:Gfo/Idh/MocA family protein n=1 Tax=Enterococcus sp. AZ194 TaxID=2774629 RepID=UPI003F21A6D5